MSIAARFEIENVLFRFMRSFDLKDWKSMHDCLQDKIYCDYSSFRNETPGKISCSDYIAKRKSALADLKTQHNLFNVSIQYSANLAKITCNYAIYRFHPKFAGAKKHFFHSYGWYSFELKCNQRQWKISSITQTLLMNDGNPELHGATRKRALHAIDD